ncbi:hypothetical protein PXW05_10320 [Serratia marcescens]|uniref:hypothetical protein n=1 Tax=Serratia marcescens TaxID=615 RepID=UPI0023B028A4|nr:hypothetical protein [Serratia marcescens]WEE06779.1 hypothetical protein PXW05_10320 [Serratia marcescens]
MTNYEMLQLLIDDGGYYTAVGHFDLLKTKFPEITENHIKSLRSAIQRSPLVVAKSKFTEGKKAFRVISIDPSYITYARARPPTTPGKITDSYIRSEPPEVVKMILLVQQFNQLITPVTHQRAY